MEFEVFNRYRDSEARTKAAPMFTVNKTSGIFFINRAAMEAMQLKPHERIELLKGGKNWYIVKTKNEAGYKLNPQTRERVMKKRYVLLSFCSKVGAAALFTDEPREVKLSFYVQDTDMEHNSHPVFELLKKPKAA